MSGREVVITGTGLTTALGKNAGENMAALTAMKTGIARHQVDGLPDFMQYKAEVKEYELPPDIPPKQEGQMKFLNRGALLGFCSSCEAISGVRERISDIPPSRRALYIASGDFTKVGYDFMYPALKDGTDGNWKKIDQERLNNAALNKVNPFYLLESLHNNLFSFLSAFLEFMGPNTSLASLSPNGGSALELAYRSIRQNKADVALAVGYGNWITEIPVYELEGLGILSKCRTGAHSYRPFDKARDGFIPGEGGAAILLASVDVAQRWGAETMGRIIGSGNAMEFSPNQRLGVPEQVIKRNLQSLLKESGCSVSDLACIIPHGSGTQKGDRSELRSIMAVLGGKKTDIPVCGMKPYTGHMGAASDIAEIIYGVHAVKNRTVPATLNFQETEKEFSEMRISNSAQPCSGNRFLSISYGVGGQSSSVIVEVDEKKT
jgi:3-oxoacyl-[acyl-carrier-protein] synthase II